MLGHPAFIARDIGRNTQRETFFAKQGVAAVARAIRPDFARFGKMHDVLFLVAGPGHVFLAGSERHADRMHARHDARAFIDFIKDALADAGHDAHADHDVGGIGELHADFCER